jgi:hypothetical protein
VRFLERIIGQLARNDYGAAWLSLYPAQRQAVPRREYVGCEQLSPIPGRLASLTVVRVRQESVRVAGGPAAPVPSTAVTFRIRLADRSIPASVVVVHTVHALRVGGRWAWILPAARYELHRSGTCTA